MLIKPNRYCQSGFSVVEIMLALALGLLLLASISKIYLSIKKSYQVQINTARVQENGRLATHILTNNIQMAGYGGCKADNIIAAVHGYTSTNVPEYLQGKAVADSDIIIIRKADVAVISLTKDINYATNIPRCVLNVFDK